MYSVAEGVDPDRHVAFSSSHTDTDSDFRWSLLQRHLACPRRDLFDHPGCTAHGITSKNIFVISKSCVFFQDAKPRRFRDVLIRSIPFLASQMKSYLGSMCLNENPTCRSGIISAWVGLMTGVPVKTRRKTTTVTPVTIPCKVLKKHSQSPVRCSTHIGGVWLPRFPTPEPCAYKIMVSGWRWKRLMDLQ